jgi:hypothetical protein
MDSRRNLMLALLLLGLGQQTLALQGSVANQNGGITDPPPPTNQRSAPNRPNAGSPVLKGPVSP